jgi:hypothetical protein
MLIMGICDNASVLSVIRVVKIIITIIKVVVPIVLIVSLMINYLSAVKSNDFDALNKTNKSMVTKIIAAMLVFYIPTLINVVSDISSFDSDNYTKCISNATKEHIDEIVVSDAKIYLKFAKQSLKRSDLLLATNMVKKVKNEVERKELENELTEIENAIKEKEKKEEEERRQQMEKWKEELEGQNPSNPGGGGGGGNTSFPLGVSDRIDNVMGVFYYKQCDDRWKNIQYDIGGGSNGGPATLCSSACGYTSFAMIAGGLNNDTSINPYSVIKYFRNIKDGELTHRGYGAASWDEIANNGRISHYNLSCETVSRSQIENVLKSGRPVIALVPGHYIVLSYSSRGNVVLLDPFVNWADRRKKSGEFKSVSDIEAIYGGIRKAVAYSKL